MSFLVAGLLAAPSAVVAQDPVRITWFVASQDKEQKQAISGLVDAFNAANPDIELVVRPAPAAKAHGRLGDLLQGGSKAPDIVGPIGLDGFTAYQDAWLDLAPAGGFRRL